MQVLLPEREGIPNTSSEGSFHSKIEHVHGCVSEVIDYQSGFTIQSP